jgi:hypothetical protein
MLPEHYFCVEAHLQIVPAYSGHVFTQQDPDASGLYVRNQARLVRALEIRTQIAVIAIVNQIGKAIRIRVAFKHRFLVSYRITFAG